MRVLVTRPGEDGDALAAALRARGHEAVIAPMLEIRAPAPGAPRPELDGVQAVLFTSANGVRAFAALTPVRDLPVFAVGDASARAARAAGFARVESAGGDVADLARLVRARCDPAAGALYHAATSRLAGDLKGDLEASGFALRRETLYESAAAESLPAAARAALESGELDAATFFSPRSAATFVALVRAAGLEGTCTRLAAFCLSAPVAEALRPLPWRAMEITARPTQDSLLAALDRTVREMPEQTKKETEPGGRMSDGHSEHDTAAPQGAESGEAERPARRIIAQFGGIRPMAHKLGVAVSTVQGWRERDSIPAARHDQILAAAEAQGIALDRAALAASDRSGETPTEPGERRTGAAEGGRTKPKSSAPAPPETGGDREKAQGAGATAGGAGVLPGRTPSARIESVRTERSGPAPSTAFLLGAAVLAVGVILAVLARGAWLPLVGGAGAGGVAPGRVAAVESRVAALESAPAPGLPAAAARRLDDLTARLDAFDARLAGLAEADDALRADLRAATARLAAPDTLSAAEQEALDALSADLESELSGLRERLDGLDARLDSRLGGLEESLSALSAERTAAAESVAGDLAALLAVLQLRDALVGSAPFATELDTLRRLAAARDDLAPAAEALAPLEPFAETGIPGRVALKAAFPEVAHAVVAAEQAGAGDDWLAGVRRRLSSLVTVRPLGAVAGESAAAIVARAEALLAEDDLAGAVAELDKLSGAPAEAAADWLAKARARVAAQRALVELNAAVSARLTEARG